LDFGGLGFEDNKARTLDEALTVLDGGPLAAGASQAGREGASSKTPFGRLFMNVGKSDYVRAIRQLPCPSSAQTERFARFVSSAHSWYKHLPIHPKVPFIFYLDPGAGMNRVETRTGETALVEVKDESTRFHYTWQKTEDYRHRFGHWNYHADYGTSFMFAGEGGVVNTAGAGLTILADSGAWVGVPPYLAKGGTAWVSALVHPCPNFDIWGHDPARFGFSEIPDPQDAGVPPTAHLVLRRLWNHLEQERDAPPNLSEVARLVPPRVLEVLRGPVARRSAATWFWPAEGSWDWPDESWLEQLPALGVEPGLRSSVVKYMEVERMRSLVVKMHRKRTPESPEWPSTVMLTVLWAIMEERGRQLAAMTEAMNRFTEAVFHA
jgi:hypothetical protein